MVRLPLLLVLAAMLPVLTAPSGAETLGDDRLVRLAEHRDGHSRSKKSQCVTIAGQRICIETSKRGDDDDDRPKKKKKQKDRDEEDTKQDDTSELTECTVLGPQGGGGCKTGLKWVCEPLKGGRRCCGCVPDKAAPAPAQ
jgi:hypothetical protein